MELFNKVTAGRLALPEKVRVNLLALGDVGSTLLLGLRLMGGDVVSSIGICDVRENAALRWEFELNQIQPPSGAALPPVEIISPEQLFDGDVFLFCASRMVPDTSVTGGDVRMAQYGLNRELAASYARMARACSAWSAIRWILCAARCCGRAAGRTARACGPVRCGASAWASCTQERCTSPARIPASPPTSRRAAPSDPTGRIWCWPIPSTAMTTPSPVN